MLTLAKRLAFGVALASAVLVARAGLTSSFATDEFTYAHAAWAIAHGEQPFRDFFLHHFPLSMQLGSLVFRAVDAPSSMALLRWLMLPFWLATMAFAALLNRRDGVWAALLVPPLLASLHKWTEFGTQFRPDPMAMAFFLASLWLATHRALPARRSAFAAGVCFVLAIWASQKAILYGVALPLAWLASALQPFVARTRAPLVRSPVVLAAGVLASAAVVALYLTWTSNWGPLYEWCFKWGVVHETRYPPREKLASLGGTLHINGHLIALALIGLGLTIARIVRRSGRALLLDADTLLVISAFTTTASYFVQNAPYGWSLVAPLSFVAIFAARALAGAIALVEAHAPGGVAPAIAALLCTGVASAQLPIERPQTPRGTEPRAVQDAMLRDVAALTAPSDPIYDNTGRYVARPHVHYLFFTDMTVRIVLADRLVREMPVAIRARGATVDITEGRQDQLPQPLRAFLSAHFLPVLGPIALWGQTFGKLAPGTPASFEAVRKAEYYVTPAAVAAAQQLQIDGVTIAAPVFELTKGAHTVAWLGSGSAPKLSILWLPRDRRQLPPLPPKRKRRS